MLTRRARWRALPPACLLAASLTPIAAAAASVATAAGAGQQQAVPAGPAVGTPAPAPASAVAAQPVELFLDASIDGERTGLLVSVMQTGSTLRMTVDTLRELGLDPARFGVAGRTDFALDEVPGLRYRYDAAAQTLDLNPDASLRAPSLLSARNVRSTGQAQASRGVLLNYNLFAQSVGGAVAGSAELRYFDRHGTLTSTGSAILRGERRGYTRYDTSWVRPFQDRLSILQLGDTVAPALGWTRALRLGGVEWRRNFELRPDLVTYPVASLAGSAVVPSSVDLYVNNVRQFSTEVPTGPFVIDQVAGLNGAGQATLVTRDALGRQVSTTLPLYVDTRLLARGLNDYAVSLGALRRDYGQHSFSYGSPAAIASWRHGWRDTVTLEGHAEAGPGLGLLGAGAASRPASATSTCRRASPSTCNRCAPAPATATWAPWKVRRCRARSTAPA
jgi:outer membrane usher protein